MLSKKTNAIVRKVLWYFVAFFILLFLTKNFILDVKYVNGQSMYPSLKNGDIIFVFKLAYGIKEPFKNKYIIRWASPQKDDIVIFIKNGHYTVKRCSLNSNQPIEFFKYFSYNENLNYAIKIDGKLIPLSGVQFRNLGGMSEQQLVPNKAILALGDNFAYSYDSRDYGFILIDGIIGKVLLWK